MVIWSPGLMGHFSPFVSTITDAASAEYWAVTYSMRSEMPYWFALRPRGRNTGSRAATCPLIVVAAVSKSNNGRLNRDWPRALLTHEYAD
jgi:hypothetical protein